MKHITLTCPVCATPDKAVGDPNEHLQGNYGAWFCFECHSKGNYKTTFEITEQGKAT